MQESSHLPPIESLADKKAEKARLKQEKLQADLDAIKNMTFDQKKELLKQYVPQDYYLINHLIDA